MIFFPRETGKWNFLSLSLFAPFHEDRIRLLLIPVHDLMPCVCIFSRRIEREERKESRISFRGEEISFKWYYDGREKPGISLNGKKEKESNERKSS